MNSKNLIDCLSKHFALSPKPQRQRRQSHPIPVPEPANSSIASSKTQKSAHPKAKNPKPPPIPCPSLPVPPHHPSYAVRIPDAARRCPRMIVLQQNKQKKKRACALARERQIQRETWRRATIQKKAANVCTREGATETKGKQDGVGPKRLIHYCE